MKWNAMNLQSVSKSADVLAQAPNLTYINTITYSDYSSFTDYYYDVVTTVGTVYVRKASDPTEILYQTTTNKSAESFCNVTIRPCNSDQDWCYADEWC